MGVDDTIANVGADPLNDTRRVCATVLKDLHEVGASGEQTGVANLVLDNLLLGVERLMRQHPGSREVIVEMMQLELDGYLTRSATAAALIRRRSGALHDDGLRNALCSPDPDGDGRMGFQIDGWIRQLPTLRALREGVNGFMAGSLEDVVAPMSKVLCLGVEMPGVLEGLITALQSKGHSGCQVTLASDATTVLKERLNRARALAPEFTFSACPWMPPIDPRDPNVALPTGQNRVWVPHLLEALPDRIAVGTLVTVKRALAPRGRVVCSTLAPSDDAPFMDVLLRWPMIRRTPSQVLELFVAAELAIVGEVDVALPALGVLGQDLASVSHA